MPLCVGDTKVGVVNDAADVGAIKLGSVVHVGAVGYAGDVASRGAATGSAKAIPEEAVVIMLAYIIK